MQGRRNQKRIRKIKKDDDKKKKRNRDKKEEERKENKADRHKSRARNSISHCMCLKTQKKVKCDGRTDRPTDRQSENNCKML